MAVAVCLCHWAGPVIQQWLALSPRPLPEGWAGLPVYLLLSSCVFKRESLRLASPLVGGPTPTRLAKRQAPECTAQGRARLRLGAWTPRPRLGHHRGNLLTQACGLWGPGGLGCEPQHRETPWGSGRGQPSRCGDHGLCQGGSLRV